MARVSRKQNLQRNQPIDSVVKSWHTALYVRLSVEDNGKDSDSIDNQIALLEEFISGHPEFHRIDTYIDNGFSGTNFLRPGFEQMMERIKRNEINCIIVKDLSRLGRNYIETSSFIEKICPLYGIRFISVNDHYDTASCADGDQLSVSLSNIVNDYYAKDISKKSSTVLRSKMDRGEFVANYAPYGYLKDPENKNHLIVDPVAALIVHRIYVWRSEGISYMGINKRLNEAGIPSPGQHRINLGIETHNNKKDRIILWNKHVVTDILHNQVYIGNLVQGKHSQELFNGIPFHRTSEDEWRIAYSTHDAIIDTNLFEKVQRINESARTKATSNIGKYNHLPKEKNLYGKRFRCAHCGATMKLHRSIKKGGDKAYFMFKCPTYAEHGKLGCFDVKIQKAQLDAAIFAFIKPQMDVFMEVSTIIDLISKKESHPKRQHHNKDRLAALKNELSRKQSLIRSLYFDLKSGVISLTDYSHHKEILTEDVESLKQEIAEHEIVETTQDELNIANMIKWRNTIEGFHSATAISEEMIDALIKSIRISQDGILDIELNFMDELESFMLNQNVG